MKKTKTQTTSQPWRVALMVAALTGAVALVSPALAQGGAEVDLEDLTRKLDTMYRSKSSRGEVKMTIITPRYERTLTMDMVTRGMDDTLIRITSPRKERGISTLKKGDEMWNYLPKVRKVVRVPPSMMTSSWMGSDLTHDDLVRGSEYREDYEVSLAPEAGKGGEVCLKYVPKEGAPVTWQKVLACFDPKTELPVRQEFYDEKGRKARTMRMDRVRTLDGRTIPTRMTLIPHAEDKEGHKTIMEFQEMDFDAEVSSKTFSMTNLRRGR